MDLVYCQICRESNQPGNRFCVHCGSEMSGDTLTESLTPPGPGPTDEPLVSVNSLRREVAQLRLELVKIHQIVRDLTVSRVGPVSRSQGSASTSSILGDQVRETHDLTNDDRLGVPRTSAIDPVNQKRRNSWWDWERVPGNWFARIGGLALIVGAGFFLALAFDNDWIGPVGQISLGILAGLVLLIAAEWWHKSYDGWSQAVSGTGIGILYLSIYASFAIHGVLNELTAFALLVLITVTGATLALRYRALALAVLAILGGFLAPIVVEGGEGDVRQLLGYLLILDLGVLWLASLRNWHWLTLLAVVGSYGIFGSYVLGVPDESQEIPLFWAQTGLALIFVIFVGATTVSHLIRKRIPGYMDLLLIKVNPALYFGINAGVLYEKHDGWLPVIALSLVLLYGSIAYVSSVRGNTTVRLTVSALVVAVVSLTIAIPLQLSGVWITIAWSAQGAALIWAGFSLGDRNTRVLGVVTFGIVAARLIVFDTFVETGPFQLILNSRALTFGASILSLYLVGYLYWKHKKVIRDWEVYNMRVFVGAANFFSLWIISAEVFRYFGNGNFAFDTESAIYLSLTLLWAIYAVVALVVGVVFKSSQVRLVALGLLSIVVLKLFLVDVSVLEEIYRVIAFTFLGLILITIGFLYQRKREALSGFFLGKKKI